MSDGVFLELPLFDDLLEKSPPAGSNILVFYDPASVWQETCATIAADWLRQRGALRFVVSSQRIETISAQVDSFLTTIRHEKLNVNTLVRDGKLEFEDWYSATLGQRSKERRYIDSLKVSDLSLLFSGQIKKGWYAPEATHTPWAEQWKWMTLTDDLSVLDRFNDERNWVELVLTRILPVVPASSLRAGIVGFARGVHSEWAYRRLEAAADIIFDLKLDESSGEARNLLRLRRARNMPADSKWHQLKYGTKGKIEFA